MSAPVRSFVQASGGVDWHVEQRGAGPHVVLIPSGEGDCASFEAVAADLAKDFTVTSFDTPGFSRSSAPADPAEISMVALAGQIAGLIRSLGIDKASFYGCSSGGLAALDLAADHAGIVRNVIVHEAALADPADGPSPMLALLQMDDVGVAQACAGLYATLMNEDQAAWQALGPDYHARLARNYVTWARHYIAGVQHAPFDPARLAGRPIAWTLGGLTQVMHFFSNVRLAHRAGVELGLLPCRHFPQVSIPTALADHIRACTAAHL